MIQACSPPVHVADEEEGKRHDNESPLAREIIVVRLHGSVDGCALRLRDAGDVAGEHEPREDAGVRVRDEDMPEDSSIIFCEMSRHVNINGYASHALRLPFFTFLSNIVSMISYMTLLPGMVLFWRASTISLLTPCSLQSLPLLELFNNIG